MFYKIIATRKNIFAKHTVWKLENVCTYTHFVQFAQFAQLWHTKMCQKHPPGGGPKKGQKRSKMVIFDISLFSVALKAKSIYICKST